MSVLFPAFFLGVFVFVSSVSGVMALDADGKAKVIEIIDGDTVRIAPPVFGASEIRLVGIQAPKLPLGRKNFKKWPLADEAKSALSDVALGKQVTLHFGGRRMDRHGRLLAHLFLENGDWVQGTLLEWGMARVYSFPDNRAEVAGMLSRERVARNNRRGIWRWSYYDVRTPDDIEPFIGTFQLVEGRVMDAAYVRGRVYLNFGENWRDDFTISVDKRARKMFQELEMDLLMLKGKRVRIRGWLKKRNGPMIEATHPEQLEILP